ncbi:MAG: hypothetical protein IJX30_09105 [Clostridia bacterium]|nr:hypothetical protein [Clostridia bacterium]
MGNNAKVVGVSKPCPLGRCPSPRPKQPYHHWWYGCFRFYGLRRGARVGAVLREQNALPYEAWIMKNLTAKDDVDNVGAGRVTR